MKKRMLVIAAAVAATTMMMTSPVMAEDFKVGICNYVDDASLIQIVDNIQSRLEEIGKDLVFIGGADELADRRTDLFGDPCRQDVSEIPRRNDDIEGLLRPDGVLLQK